MKYFPLSLFILSKRLKQSLENLNKPFFYDLTNIDQGVKIARRTITKYREILKILPSSKRKII